MNLLRKLDILEKGIEMNNINIDLDEVLVEYIKEKCDRDITLDIDTIVKMALYEKQIEM